MISFSRCLLDLDGLVDRFDVCEVVLHQQLEHCVTGPHHTARKRQNYSMELITDNVESLKREEARDINALDRCAEIHPCSSR